MCLEWSYQMQWGFTCTGDGRYPKYVIKWIKHYKKGSSSTTIIVKINECYIYYLYMLDICILIER